MEVGISTASLFLRNYVEDALPILDSLGAKVCEVFLNTFPEYAPPFGELLKTRLGGLKVNSMHTYTFHFEPELFSQSMRSRDVADNTFKDVLSIGKTLGAKYYTMHARGRLKKHASPDNFEAFGKGIDRLVDIAEEYGIRLCLENVEWASYNRVGFFREIKKFSPKLGGVLDVKQARLSGMDYRDYLDEMGKDLCTVHLSDVDENGRIRLPGKGIFDFEELFKRLIGIGFDGNMLIEVYKDDYGETSELKDSLDYLREILYKLK